MASKKRVSFSDCVSGNGYEPRQGNDEPSDNGQPPPDEGEGEAEPDVSMGSFTDPARRPPCIPPRVAYCSDGTPHAAATSPVRKKISALQDRRVNTILLEALQLVDCSKEELAVIDRSVKKLRDAIYGFSILVDKQVNIIGAETLEERGRIRADIQDLAENLKHSYEVFETTCDRMRATLNTGKQQIQIHRKRVSPTSPAKAARIGSESPTFSSSSSSPSKRSSGHPGSPSRRVLPMNVPAPSPSVAADSGLSFSPACGRVALLPLLEWQPLQCRQRDDDSGEGVDGIQPFMTPELFSSITRSVGLDEKEFLDQRDLVRFMQEMFTFAIAKSHALTFMGKAFHRRLLPVYARDLVAMVAHELQLSTSTTSLGVVPANTLYDYMCQPPHLFDELLDRLYVTDANQYTGDPSPAAPPMEVPAANPFSDHFSRNGGVLHDGKVVQSLLVNRPDAERLETAEQTLAMAKLLHDLATAESEARHGSRISIRAQPTRDNEFSKVYLATSKELLSKETGIH